MWQTIVVFLQSILFYFQSVIHNKRTLNNISRRDKIEANIRRMSLNELNKRLRKYTRVRDD